MYRKKIVSDRKTGDFAMSINDELVGYAANYVQAEATLNKLVYELLTKDTTPASEQPAQSDYAAEHAA